MARTLPEAKRDIMISNSVTCDTGYSESGSVAGGDLGCLNCAHR